MKNLFYHIPLALVFFISLLFSSCRDEIISPDSPAGNINQPVQIKSNSLYTFILSANNLSTTIIDYPELSGTRPTLNISLNNFEQGQLSLNIYENPGRLVYQTVLTGKINPFSAILESVHADRIEINFISFTGNLKIQLISQ